ncbi:fungal-specific transcription factor domain-containing protein [Aspergillus venezuelensis]
MADSHPKSSEPGPRVSHRRAHQACLGCRRRKVRCDVVSKGQPCTNCTLDQKPCEIKRRQQRRQYEKPVFRQPADTAQLTAQEPTPRLVAESFTNLRPPEPDSLSGSNYFTDSRDTGSPPRLLAAPSISNPAGRSAHGDAPFTAWSDYPFLYAKIDASLPECDLALLEQRGSLSVPVRWLLDEFVREYFLHVHPTLPIVNEANFWDAYTNSRPEPIPLMLFQAMLFAASSFVSDSCIRSCGFSSTRAARAAFYHRPKALYDLGIHHDTFCCAQTSLLLTYYVTSRDPNINSYWLAVALHHARVIQANRYYEIKHERANLLKRIWWACIYRDRHLSLGLRRPLQITARDFDFTQPALTMSDFADEIHRSLVYGADTKRALIMLLGLQCELAVALTNALALLFPGTPTASTNHACLAIGVKDLVRWYARAQAQFSLLDELSGDSESVILFRNLPLVYYHSARLASYNHAIYLAVDSRQGAEIDHSNGSSAGLEHPVSDHIRGITECLVQLSQRDLLKYLPITAVANITLPLAWYIIGSQISYMKVANGLDAAQFIYTRAIKVLRARYEGTDEVLDYIQRILHQLRVGAPYAGREPAERLYSKALSPRLSPLSLCSKTPSTAQENSVVIYTFAHCPPREYVRISQTIDTSLARGRFADRADLPNTLRLLEAPSMDTRLYYCPSPPSSSSIRTNELFSSMRWSEVSRPHQSVLQGPSVDAILDGPDIWDGPAYEDNGGELDDLTVDDTTALALQLHGQTALESYPTTEPFDVFSGIASSGDLESLSALGSSVDSGEVRGDEGIMNVFAL